MKGLQVRAIERKNNKPVAYHNFPTVAADRNGYRAAVSFNAFNEAMKDVCVSDRNARRFSTYTPDDLPALESMEQSMRELGMSMDKLPQYNHKDIWAFYKAIGYDYKKKRFTSDKN